MKGRINEARQSLKFVTPNLPESELDAIRDVATKASETSVVGADSLAAASSSFVLEILTRSAGIFFCGTVAGDVQMAHDKF